MALTKKQADNLLKANPHLRKIVEKGILFDELLVASENFIKGWKHFSDCIDFGKSFFDAKAIQFMNEVPGQIQQIVVKIKEIEK